MPPKAIVLLSGGLDSATTLYWAQKTKKWACHGLLFDYGQRHDKELRAAQGLARLLKVPVHKVKISLPWGGSSLLKGGKRLPAHKAAAIGKGPIPSTYVPARNTIFLSFAFSWADAVEADHIVIGANALDYSGYPDCRADYFTAFQKAGRLGTRQGTEKKRPLRIWTPLIHLSKAGIVRLGTRLGVPYEKTWSCYQGGRRPCGQCDSCQLRAKGFQEAGKKDPLFP